jgi:threonine/homoserine/homoserine lactone efflux protein
VLEVVLSGLVTGWAIAVPVGAVGAYLVTLTARTSFRVGAAAGLGVATVDGTYAAAAVVGGAALSALISPVADRLRVASAVVLLVIAGLTIAQSLRPAAAETRASSTAPRRASRSYWRRSSPPPRGSSRSPVVAPPSAGSCPARPGGG